MRISCPRVVARELSIARGFATLSHAIRPHTTTAGKNVVVLSLALLPTRTVFAGAASNEAPLATAGQILRTVNSSRQIQLG